MLDDLAAQRYVEISVKAHKLTTVSELQYKEGEWKEVTKQEEKVIIVVVPIIIPFIKRQGSTPGPTLQPQHAPNRNTGPQKNHIPPRDLGKAREGYATTTQRRKQPSQLNNGANSGSRGQRSPYTLSRHTVRRNGR